MKNWIIVAVMPILVSCTSMKSTDNFYNVAQQKRGEINSFELPQSAINDVVKGLAYQMLDSSSFVTPKTPIAVASFVDIKDLESTNWLGNQIAESFIHELQRHGMIVVDYKTTGHIRVTKEGDYVFSRDWKELPERQIIDYVVAGTMVEQEGGVMINARMIGMQSRVVVATSQSFVPDWAIGEQVYTEQNVRMKDGMIMRDGIMLNDDSRAITIQQ
jgi:TolB-like protein